MSCTNLSWIGRLVALGTLTWVGLESRNFCDVSSAPRPASPLTQISAEPLEPPLPAVSVPDAAALRASCSGGAALACNDLGVLLYRGQGVATDARKARALFARGCELGAPESCGNLGALYENAEGGERDTTLARRLYQRACDAGVALSCSNLGAATLRVPKADSRREAAELFARACSSGCEIACRNLSTLSQLR